MIIMCYNTVELKGEPNRQGQQTNKPYAGGTMNEDRCVCCGAVIPEGRMVCPICERKANNPAPKTS